MKQQPYTFYIKRAIVIRLNVHCDWSKIECRWMVGHLLFHNTSKCFYYYISSSVGSRHVHGSDTCVITIFITATWMQFFNCLPVQIGWRHWAKGTVIMWLRKKGEEEIEEKWCKLKLCGLQINSNSNANKNLLNKFQLNWTNGILGCYAMPFFISFISNQFYKYVFIIIINALNACIRNIFP